MRFEYLLLGIASLAYFGLTCYRAARRLFWFDELFTVYIGTLPNFNAIYAACRHGADTNPPLLYWLAHWSQEIFGHSELGVRMPEVVGFWVFCLCIYRFISLRVGIMGGLVAMLLPLTTSAYWYAYEARAYALILGFFGLALVSWQAAASRKPGQWIPLAGLALSLFGAALSHGYAFLCFIALGIGELTRTVVRRRIDWQVWGAIFLPAIGSVLIVVSLLHNIDPIRQDIPLSEWQAYWERTWAVMLDGELALLFLILLAASAMWPSQQDDRPLEPPAAGTGTFAKHELAVWATTICTPILTTFGAHLGHAPLYTRYAIITLAGSACLGGAIFARSRKAAIVALSIILFVIGMRFMRFRDGNFDREPVTGLNIATRSMDETFHSLEAQTPGGAPIVLAEGFALPILHYAPPALRSRLVFLNADSNIEAYHRLQNCCGAPGLITPSEVFFRSQRTFYVYCSEAAYPSQSQYLAGRGARLSGQHCGSGSCVFLVQLPQASSP